MDTPSNDRSSIGLTADYQPREASVGHAPLVVAVGSGETAAEDLRRLLRRRLRFLCPVLAALLSVGAVLVLSTRTLTTIQLNGWSVFACLILSLLLAGLVWTQYPFSLGQLRVIELVVVAILATRIASRIHLVFWSGDAARVFQAWRETGDELILHERLAHAAFATSLTAAVYIVAYGVCIPNNWRRCVLVVAFLWSLVPALWVAGCITNELPRSVWLGAIFRAGVLDLTFAAALAVYGSHRVEILRRGALEARRLGQYVLRNRLGTGGMGEVYLADHVLLRRPCAIKLIRPDRAGDARNLQRFEREVQATATLTHANAVQIFDYGRSQDGTFYYVMEYLPGLTLEELVTAHGPLPPGRAVHFLRQICGALHEAHAIGLIHRDIKPSNVMVCERGRTHDVVKLLDFGLVKTHFDSDGDDRLTHQGTVIGTPAFLSPEQAAGSETLDARSDIYSLGALAYFLLAGQPPFAGRPQVKILAAHFYESPAPLTSHRSDVPPELEAVILKCLAKNPTDRFPDIRTLAKALAECGGVNEWTDEDATQWWQPRNGSQGQTASSQGHEEASRGKR